MRKSNTLDRTELWVEIERRKDANLISISIFNSLSNALDRRNLALRSMKRMIIS